MKHICYLVHLLIFPLSIQAQDEKKDKISFDFCADLVSSYVWRGGYQTNAAVQPSMVLNVDGFSFSAWGSVPFSGTSKEVDFTIGYKKSGFFVAITDYWWAGEEAYKYFTYDAHKTEHHFEASLGYTLPTGKFPLSLSWNTMFAGEDYYKSDAKRAYSTYIMAIYPFSVKNVQLEFEVGLTPWEGIYANSFSVVSIGLKATKELRITDNFSVPAFAQVLANPRSEDIFFVFGISL